jgi:hypothetical protein
MAEIQDNSQDSQTMASLANTTSEAQDQWLLDSGVDIHSVNDEKWFIPGTARPIVQKIEIQTVNGPVYPEKISTSEFFVEGPDRRPVCIRAVNALYIPSSPSNILSGYQLYGRNGWIDRNNVVGPDGEVLTKLQFKKTGFYLKLAKKAKIQRLQLISRKDRKNPRAGKAEPADEADARAGPMKINEKSNTGTAGLATLIKTD